MQIALKLLRVFFAANQGKYKLPYPATYESLELVKKHNIFVKYTQKPSQNFYTKNKKYFLRRRPISKYIATSSEKSDLGIANYLYFTNKHIFYILLRTPQKKRKQGGISQKTQDAALANRTSILRSDQRKNPLTISSSASFSVSPRVISFISCSPAIFPIAAS